MNPLLPLEMLQAGEWADVADVQGEPAWVARMAELGVRVDCRLEVLQPGSPCLLQINGSRLCVRGEQAMQILVHPVAVSTARVASPSPVRMSVESC